MNRDALRAKQNAIIAIAKRRGYPDDVPISDVQFGAPTVAELKGCLFPDFEHSIDSFLANHPTDPDQREQPKTL